MRAPRQVFNTFFNKMFLVLIMRTLPASNRAKPHCTSPQRTLSEEQLFTYQALSYAQQAQIVGGTRLLEKHQCTSQEQPDRLQVLVQLTAPSDV